ncbi:MAG TPA: tetratricopeptide repeat protein [Steroidobacteraceae bacterium]|nr:tetratricopeptide repeat protein [Steroidobacteraceae bacterium]
MADPIPTIDEVLSWCEARLREAPADPAPLLEAARLLRRHGQGPAAIRCLEQASALRPDSAAIHHDRGVLLQALGDLDGAAVALHCALERSPGFAPTHAALASVRRAQGDRVAAIAGYRTAVALEPGLGSAHNNLGLALRDAGDLAGAVQSYRAAIAASPALARPYYNLGVALRELRLLPEALAMQRAALARRSPYPLAESELLRCSLELGDWAAIEASRAGVAAAIAGGEVVPPFTVLGTFDDPALQLRVAQRYAASLAPTPAARPEARRRGRERLRVAYLSADFHRHATSYLMVELLELHDRERFEIVGVSFGPDDRSDLRRRVRGAFDTWLEAGALPDAEVAAWLRAQAVDLAVDLKGYTQGARPGILARRPAPVQLSYLGYPGTMGAPHIDYLVADAFVVPPAERPHYAEAIIYLPDCYQPNDRHRVTTPGPPTRREHGLPERGFVFCCFNNGWKINREMFGVWMRLLAQVPQSALWLLAWNDWQPDNLRAAAARAGIDPGRLVFGARVPIEQHLARHALADLFLDTVPCNAHTTASDALWSGLPVLTVAGRSFAARVAGSLLRTLGLEDLVCGSLDAYERRALSIATGPGAASELRARLQAARQAAPLFDADRYRLQLEQAFVTVAARAARAEPPTDLWVAPSAPGAASAS